MRSRLQGAEPEVWVDGNELCIETIVAKWSIRLLPNEEIPADSPAGAPMAYARLYSD